MKWQGENGGDPPTPEQQRERHRETQGREPPVDVGDVERAGVVDVSTHHSGDRHAVCKVEGFVVFVEDAPDDLAVGDVLESTVLSFNRGRTSAAATFHDTVG